MVTCAAVVEVTLASTFDPLVAALERGAVEEWLELLALTCGGAG